MKDKRKTRGIRLRKRLGRMERNQRYQTERKRINQRLRSKTRRTGQAQLYCTDGQHKEG